MTRTRRLRPLWLLLLLALLLLGLAVFLGLFRPSSVSADIEHPLSADDMRELRPRGRELAMAGDCFGCHSRAEGPMAAGGVAIATPFGTLHSTNITPDPKHGIGRYSRADFHRALRDGVAPGGRNLYPAMPYVFTHLTRPEDADALYAYLKSIPPLAVPNVANTGVYVLPLRGFMNFWNLLNFPRQQNAGPPDAKRLGAAASADAAPRSAQWTRGAYLVEGLAHCAACHTPMNVMMGTDFSRHFEGAIIDGMQAPDIRAETLGRQGYTIESLTQFLQTGIAPQGTSFAGMYTVTHASTSNMQADDVRAMAEYLLTGQDGRTVAATPAPDAPARAPGGSPVRTTAGADVDAIMLESGRLTYLSACAGCHGMAGEGIPNVAPAMRGNATLLNDEPHNFIKVVLDGIPTQQFSGHQRMYAMPGFAEQLSDADIAALTRWAMREWGGKAQQTTAEAVGKLRQ